MTKRLIPVILVLMMALPAFAQDTGGQLWVQAFEDRNGNGQHDPGEPFLTHGVSVDLLNGDGVVMASGTLDNAPFASQGFIGFLYLAPGKYTAVITSPDLTATTPDRVDVTITAGEAPVTVPFGAERAAADTSSAASGSASFLNSQLARVALAGFGALIVIGLMGGIGVLIYALVLARRAPRDLKRTTTTSGMRPVRVGADQSGELRRTGEGEMQKP